MAKRRTGLVYDPQYLAHETGNHPENPQRLSNTVSVLKSSGMMSELIPITPKPADEAQVASVHSVHYIQSIKQLCQAGGGYLTMDTPVSAKSFDTALLAAGGAIGAVDALFLGVQNAFVLARPPGHHAEPSAGMGFCIFNNVAIAARHAQKKHGLKRIAIIDWDLHHGNGTERIFYSDPSVLYFSIHQSPAYPGTGRVDDVGTGEGEGFNVNVPVPPGSGDEVFLRVLDEIAVPVITEYKPDLIIVSAGQDAYHADPIGELNVTVEGYAQMASKVVNLSATLCNDRLICVLEGGYNLQALPYCVMAILNQMLNLQFETHDPSTYKPRFLAVDQEQIERRINAVKQVHAKYWNCFK